MRYGWALALGLGSAVVGIGACGGSSGGEGGSGDSSNSTGDGFGGGLTTGSGQGNGRGNSGGEAGSGGGGIVIPDAGSDGATCAHATTCKHAGKDCGPISDGCSGVIQCGECTAPETCGGSGVASVCGQPPCQPQTCADQQTTCGPVGDGCGNQLSCGDCSGIDTCGGGGVSGQCGHGMICQPQSCADQNINCGPAGDGCGAGLDCGTCTAPASCGGGGESGICGVPPCVPNTCAGVNADCGPIADGCGGIVDCGTCSLPDTCGGLGVQSQCATPASCINLCTQQRSCPGGGTTSLSGTVYAPNGTDPLPNVLVYVPNAAVQPFVVGVTCDNCASSVTGTPLVSAVTDTAGNFSITNMPVGANIPLVIQTGRWRRQVTISNVSQCQNTVADPTLTRLPRNQSEGDIPHMAFVTGNVDGLECVMRKIGVDDAEFTKPSLTGRIHMFLGNDGAAGDAGASAPGVGTTPGESTLWSDINVLDNYDMVLFPCQGAEHDKTTAARKTGKDNLRKYADAGGRIFATHFSYVWLYDEPIEFSLAATWHKNQAQPTPDPGTGTIDQSFPKGQELAEWLQNVGASTTLGQIQINTLRKDTDGVVSPSQSWMTVAPSTVMHFTFNTPVGNAPDQQCGRVLFDDFHVEDDSNSTTNGKKFPAECPAAGTAMTPQEKLLEFMLFDLGSCVTPDHPTCTPVDCTSQNIGCGPAGDGCGNIIQCGDCDTPDTCGGGGTPSQCGAPSCIPKTCTQENIECGPAGDGCGNLIQCGDCQPGKTCGGGGTPGKCGSGSCTSRSCATQGIDCGPAGDGCGNLLQCGTCTGNNTCGGGGTPGKCGSQCTKLTCAGLGYTCGAAGDGCGGELDCGTCGAPQTCGGGGTPNKCGGAVPH